MEKMDPFMKVIRCLNASGVPYVIVGGFAAVMHGVNRITADIDIVVDLNSSRIESVVRTLIDEGFVSRLPVDPLLFANAEVRSQWVNERNMQVFTLHHPDTPSFAVDLFAKPPLDFETLNQNASDFPLGGQSARICSVDDLIRMKTQAGRAIDRRDIEDLTTIYRRKGQQP